jgi:hypothetical protein
MPRTDAATSGGGNGTMLAVTIHPSSFLRIEDEHDKRSAYKDFVADLKAAKALLDKGGKRHTA